MCSFDRQECEEDGRSGVDAGGFELDVAVEVEVVDALVRFTRGAVELLLSFSVGGSGTRSLDGSVMVGMICV